MGGFVDILVLQRGSAPHPRKSSRACRKFDAIRFPPRDDLRHSPRRGEETLLPLPERERAGVRVEIEDVNKDNLGGDEKIANRSRDVFPVVCHLLSGFCPWLLLIRKNSAPIPITISAISL